MTALMASIDPMGDYFSPLKIAAVFVLVLPWLWFVPWAQRDARRTLTPEQLVGGLLLGVGAIGLIVWLALPMFGVGLAIFAVLTIGPSLGYLIYRDGKVPAQHRVLTMSHLTSMSARKDARKIKVTTRLKVYDSDGRLAVAPDEEEASIEVKLAYNGAQDLLYDLLSFRASEADLTPVGQEAKLRFLVDGAVTTRPSLDGADSDLIIQHIKLLAGLNADQRRKPQQGQISIDLVNQAIDLIVTTAGTTSGQRLQFRVVQESIQTQLDQLGMSEDVQEKITDANQVGGGLIIVSAPARNGLTSTLYSLLRCHDSFTMQLTTLEAKVAFEQDNVSQHAYGKDPAAMRKLLVSSLRHEPHVVMIDACKDPEAASVIVQAARERLILLGVSATDSFTALAKWAKVCGNATEAMASLKIVLAQVLVRKLCTECREPYRPDPSLLAKANLQAGDIKEFYRTPTKPRLDDKDKPLVDRDGNAIPCPACHGTGYYGRTGVFELLEITNELRELVAAGAALSKIKAACRKNQMLYLQEQALQKVIAGISSVQEVIRVTQPQSKAKAKAKKA